MAAEMTLLNEIVDALIDVQLLLNHNDDGEFHLISATLAFTKRDLKRIFGLRGCVAVLVIWRVQTWECSI